MARDKHGGLGHRARRDELLRIAEQAAAWLVELEEGGAAERAACAAWLEESPLHVEMFLRAGAVDRLTELMSAGDLKALAERQWNASDAVTAFPGSSAGFGHRGAPVSGASAGPPEAAPSSESSGRTRVRSKGRTWRLAGVAAGLLALATGGAWYEAIGPGSWRSFETTIGEQRVVALEDGSLIHVNTNSRIEVRYTDTERNVRLRDGEALFRVERDARRPFQVLVGDTVVRAVGTEFNVYHHLGELKVAVVEGVVQVSHAAAGASADSLPIEQHRPVEPTRGTARLAAGQGLILRGDGALDEPSAVDISQVTAWQQRRLVFEWQTLAEIAAEFNRYNRTPQIRVEGEEIAQRRYTAVFDADNPQTLLRFLSKDEDLVFAADGNDFVIREAELPRSRRTTP